MDTMTGQRGAGVAAAAAVLTWLATYSVIKRRINEIAEGYNENFGLLEADIDKTSEPAYADTEQKMGTYSMAAIVAAVGAVVLELISSPSTAFGLTHLADSKGVIMIAAVALIWFSVCGVIKRRIQEIQSGYDEQWRTFEGYDSNAAEPLHVFKKQLCPIAEDFGEIPVEEPGVLEIETHLAVSINTSLLSPSNANGGKTKESSSSVGGVWELQLS